MTKTKKAEIEAERIRREAREAEAKRIVRTGHCPDCAAPLKRNNALAGWWQCVAYASPDFRDPEYRHLPKCHFQTFTS